MSGNVTPSLKLTSAHECFEGEAQRVMKGGMCNVGWGGLVVVIICAYEEGRGSLVALFCKLLCFACLWGEATQGCIPLRLLVNWVPKRRNMFYLFTHQRQ